MDSPDDEEEAPSLYTLPTLIYFELPFLVSKGRGMFANVHLVRTLRALRH